MENITPSGKLVLPYSGTGADVTTAFVIEAPRVAVRYGKLSMFTANPPGSDMASTALTTADLKNYVVNTRAINGAQDIKSSAIGSIVQFLSLIHI